MLFKKASSLSLPPWPSQFINCLQHKQSWLEYSSYKIHYTIKITISQYLPASGKASMETRRSTCRQRIDRLICSASIAWWPPWQPGWEERDLPEVGTASWRGAWEVQRQRISVRHPLQGICRGSPGRSGTACHVPWCPAYRSWRSGTEPICWFACSAMFITTNNQQHQWVMLQLIIPIRCLQELSWGICYCNLKVSYKLNCVHFYHANNESLLK